jgi:hypothetical protein
VGCARVEALRVIYGYRRSLTEVELRAVARAIEDNGGRRWATEQPTATPSLVVSSLRGVPLARGDAATLACLVCYALTRTC